MTPLPPQYCATHPLAGQYRKDCCEERAVNRTCLRQLLSPNRWITSQPFQDLCHSFIQSLRQKKLCLKTAIEYVRPRHEAAHIDAIVECSPATFELRSSAASDGGVFVGREPGRTQRMPCGAELLRRVSAERPYGAPVGCCKGHGEGAGHGCCDTTNDLTAPLTPVESSFRWPPA